MKTKRQCPAPARELYTSALFAGRRRFVERSCDRWFVLSAKHSLVEPEQTLAPYDETLRSKPVAERRAWPQRVLRDLEREPGDLGGHEFELHAGTACLAHGLEAGLSACGASVVVPARGLRRGEQLRFYRKPPGGAR